MEGLGGVGWGKSDVNVGGRWSLALGFSVLRHLLFYCMVSLSFLSFFLITRSLYFLFGILVSVYCFFSFFFLLSHLVSLSLAFVHLVPLFLLLFFERPRSLSLLECMSVSVGVICAWEVCVWASMGVSVGVNFFPV